jgi:excisionase family DNA binding protein
VSTNNCALTVADVCARYKVHANTVRNMAKDGRLKSGGTGREYRFSPDECDRVFLGIDPKTKEEAA